MFDDSTSQTHNPDDFALLQYQYDRLCTTLDDPSFHQSASHLLDTIQIRLRGDNAPLDVASAYQELERQTRAQVIQRLMLPNHQLGS